MKTRLEDYGDAEMKCKFCGHLVNPEHEIFRAYDIQPYGVHRKCWEEGSNGLERAKIKLYKHENKRT